jgi:hypothetical protein
LEFPLVRRTPHVLTSALFANSVIGNKLQPQSLLNVLGGHGDSLFVNHQGRLTTLWDGDRLHIWIYGQFQIGSMHRRDVTYGACATWHLFRGVDAAKDGFLIGEPVAALHGQVEDDAHCG